MSNVEMFKLDVWKGDWGLPSVDINCLQVLAYANFCKIPLVINATNNPFKSPNGQLPVLRHQKGTVDTAKNILQFFRENNYCLDFGLSPKQCAEVNAYESLLREKIYPALQFIWWIDEQNFQKDIRPWYGKAMPYFLNYYYLSKYETNAKDLMTVLYPSEDEISIIETNVYAEAQKCLNLLEERLGDSEYFYGSSPTTLDALIFSYLAPILKIPLTNAALQNYFKGCTKLERFVTRISVKYFLKEKQVYEQEKSIKYAKSKESASGNDYPHKMRNKILAGVFASLIMLSYAVSTGILEISIKDENSSDDYSIGNRNHYDEDYDDEEEEEE